MLPKLTTNRRHFLQRASLATIAASIFPNLLVNRTYAGVCSIIDVSGDKRVKLSNSSFARSFDVGSWSRIRVGVRFRFMGTGNVTSSPQFFVGLISGSTNQVMDATTTNAIGAGSNAVDWFYVDAADDYYDLTNTFVGGKRVATTWSNAPGLVSIKHPANNKLLCVMSDITTGSPNYTCGSLYPSVGASTEISRDTFLTQMAIGSNPTATSHSYGSGAIAFSQGAGTLDHVCVSWNKFAIYCEVTDLAIAKIA